MPKKMDQERVDKIGTFFSFRMARKQHFGINCVTINAKTII